MASLRVARSFGGVKAGLVGLLERETDLVATRRTKKPVRQQVNPAEFKGLECLLCFVRYSFNDVLEGLYQLETMVCSKCYALMQAGPYRISCFGKPTIIFQNGKRLYGYNPKAEECSHLCPDRNICRRIVYEETDND